jgi:hypothetical protein
MERKKAMKPLSDEEIPTYLALGRQITENDEKAKAAQAAGAKGASVRSGD